MSLYDISQLLIFLTLGQNAHDWSIDKPASFVIYPHLEPFCTCFGPCSAIFRVGVWFKIYSGHFDFVSKALSLLRFWK